MHVNCEVKRMELGGMVGVRSLILWDKWLICTLELKEERIGNEGKKQKQKDNK